ncbi:MAG: lipoyl(octanoyl) transferase LipB [Proteobacteria bacterium]|nr:lipoyl(octanoyl) transferase LipB [Pseudomonadota bacterium]
MSQRADVVIKRLGLVEYEPTWRDMQTFTDRRDAQTTDEIWLLQHPPVYTLGLNGNREDLLAPADIPVINIDRGGQVTYHGPGQLVVYPLIDLRRQSLGVRELVSALEQSVIDLATDYGIEAQSKADAPGVYVDGRKLASLGLRIRRGCSYHGLAFNIDMDLEPFSRINPCGFADLEVIQLKDLGGPADLEKVAAELEHYLLKNLKYAS